MKRMKKTTPSVLICILLLFAVLLSACGVQKTTEVRQEIYPSSEPEMQAEIEPITDDVEISETPPEVQLPPKPAIDIYSWEYLLANSFNSISEYQPPYSAFEGQGINANIVQPAMDFIQAARDAGFHVWCSAAYRNYEYLDNRFRGYRVNLAEDAVSAANKMLAAGLNEHQTGLCIDFTDNLDYSAWYGDFEDEYMKDTELYQWLVEHCADYGFVLRYPEGKEQFYGVACNHPAHFRYVGKEAAKYIMENNLCLEEFIMLYDESLVFLPAP